MKKQSINAKDKIKRNTLSSIRVQTRRYANVNAIVQKRQKSSEKIEKTENT
ncbi:MAG: hypothetical protein HUU50_04955 [Candidatus Brocadiae bacterium]|nr:hypothetical protein [Candidatus Brocadiia bacterium]